MTETPSHAQLPLEAKAEAVIFAAGEPVALEALARALGCTAAELEASLPRLEGSLAGRGLSLLRQADLVQLVTTPAAAAAVQGFLQAEQQVSLSAAAMETVAVIAYRQPVTRIQIEAVRGVSCDSSLRTLMRLGLIAELDRLDQPGRPITYGTTAEFLRTFGLRELDELPPLSES